LIGKDPRDPWLVIEGGPSGFSGKWGNVFFEPCGGCEAMGSICVNRNGGAILAGLRGCARVQEFRGRVGRQKKAQDSELDFEVADPISDGVSWQPPQKKTITRSSG
jgi:hypothetical protein